MEEVSLVVRQSKAVPQDQLLIGLVPIVAVQDFPLHFSAMRCGHVILWTSLQPAAAAAA